MQGLNEKQYRQLSTKKEFSRYVKQSGIKDNQRIIGREKWIRFIVDFYEEVLKYATETESGIYVPKLGYFFNWFCPVKMVPKMKRRHEIGDKHMYNFHSQNRMYIPTFMPVTNLSYYSMDKTFSKPYKQAIAKKIKEGFKYKTYFHTLKKAKKIF